MRFRYMIIMVLSLFCLSCSNDDSGYVVKEYPVEVVLGCDMTKVGIDGDQLFWQSGDRIAFRAKGESGAEAVAVLTLNDVDSGLPQAKFKGTVTMTEQPVSCEFAYPETAFDESGKSVFDYSHQDGTHKPYLYGTCDYSAGGMTAMLGHVGGLIRLAVAEGVTSVTLSSNDGIYVDQNDGSRVYSGQKVSKVVLGAGGTVSEAEGAGHVIEASVPDGAGTVYLFMPAMRFSEGFTIVCHKGEGEKMFRSFSENGSLGSSYTFASGSVLDIDMSVFDGFTADCELTGVHVYDDENGHMLTGTEVTLAGFEYSGSSAKIIDNWGVSVYFEDSRYAGNDFVRGLSVEGAYDGKPRVLSDFTNNWPLLFPGTAYKVYAFCQINGQTLQFESTKEFKVPDDLQITVMPVAETSWNYRNVKDDSGNITANSMDNSSVTRMGLKVNVSEDIINHTVTDYGFTARIQNTTSGYESNTGELKMNTNFASKDGLNISYSVASKEYEVRNGAGFHVLSGLAWRGHNIVALVRFNGKDYSNHTTAYVTGLPFRHNFKTNQNLAGGTVSGGEDWHKHNGLELRYYYNWLFSTTQYTRYYYSPQFALPSENAVSFTIKVNGVNTGLSPSTYTACTGIVSSTSSPSQSFKASNLSTDGSSNFDTAANAAATVDHSISGTGKMTSSSRVSASVSDGDWSSLVENGVYLSYMEILYN